jgi:hypothetical protein
LEDEESSRKKNRGRAELQHFSKRECLFLFHQPSRLIRLQTYLSCHTTHTWAQSHSEPARRTFLILGLLVRMWASSLGCCCLFDCSYTGVLTRSQSGPVSLNCALSGSCRCLLNSCLRAVDFVHQTTPCCPISSSLPQIRHVASFVSVLCFLLH